MDKLTNGQMQVNLKNKVSGQGLRLFSPLQKVWPEFQINEQGTNNLKAKLMIKSCHEI